jgi:hypothetical protein
MELAFGFIAQLARLTQPVWFAVMLTTGFILFAPPDLAGRLDVEAMRVEHNALIGLSFLVSLSLSLVSTGQAFLKLARTLWERGALTRRRRQNLQSLTPAEKAYLLPFIESGENTQHWPMNDGIAGGLLSKKILYRSSSIFDMIKGIPYNLQPWARDALTRNPELLQGYDPGFLPRKKEDSWRI